MKCLLAAVAGTFLLGCSITAHETSQRDSQVSNTRGTSIKIKLSSVFVDDQSKALRFYTEILGFVKKTDIPVGEFSFLTVASPAGPEGIELLLEPNSHPAAKAFQEAIYKDGIPATAFFVEDLQQAFERLRSLGVEFKQPPRTLGESTFALFDDTCGNLIQLHEE